MTEYEPSRSTLIASRLTTLLLVLTVAFGVYLVGSSILGAVNGDHEVTAHQYVSPSKLDTLPPSVVQNESLKVPVTIRIPDAEPDQLFIALGRDMTFGLLMIAILWILRSILVSVRKGSPFTETNVRALRLVGLLLVVGVPVANYIAQLLEGMLAGTTEVGEIGGSFGGSIVPSGALLAGLGVFVLAEVFAYGVRLREDVEGTV